MKTNPSVSVARVTRTPFGRAIARVLIVCFVAQAAQLGDIARAEGAARDGGWSTAGFGRAGITVFGPKDYVRSTGQPETVSDTFTVSNPGNALLHITNGGASGQYEKVSSAVITSSVEPT